PKRWPIASTENPVIASNIASVSVTDVLAALAKSGLTAKTVILTTAINPERVTQFLRDGVKDVIVKPYSGSEVNELLK
ncbi:MAG: hypothetical protein PHQ36_01950, partial [Anaerolineales bacterium]|nr:hypothetical protein [Anaerolineales bacterium]